MREERGALAATGAACDMDRAALCAQKWSDHCPVALDLAGMAAYDAANMPAPCKLSSRWRAASSLGALFQRAKRKQPDDAAHDACVVRSASDASPADDQSANAGPYLARSLAPSGSYEQGGSDAAAKMAADSTSRTSMRVTLRASAAPVEGDASLLDHGEGSAGTAPHAAANSGREASRKALQAARSSASVASPPTHSFRARYSPKCPQRRERGR